MAISNTTTATTTATMAPTPSTQARLPLSRMQLIGLCVLLAAACALPFLVSNYRVFQFTLTLVYAIALLGLNMLTGYNGQISLGHGAFFAIGAIAGMMVAPTVFLEPNMLSGILLYAVAAALLGGIDSPGGAVLGGFIVGVLENVVGAYLGTELKLTVALALIVGVLVIRPSGLFGKVLVTRV